MSTGRHGQQRLYIHVAGGSTVLALLLFSIYTALAAPPGNPSFERTWQRTDLPVRDGQVARTWMWGPEANTGILTELYAEAPGGERDVQYFDKARMEITHPDADPSSVWYVTNGLLVVELITGNLQTGDASFEQRSPAQVNVAGDADDASDPQYASFTTLLDAAPAATGATLTSRVDRAGIVSDDPALASQGVTVALVDEVTNHAIAAPFWEFMTSSGPVSVDGQLTTEPLFENPYFATGRPITEAYWATVKVAGTERDVLMQCFERRCLTYTPGNPEGFVVEAGNVGQHYYQWRYGQQPGEPTPTATATATSTATATMTASPTASPSPTATATETPAPEYEFSSQWGKPYVPFTRLKAPAGLAVDGTGHAWVADTRNHRVIEYDEHGVFVRVLGNEGNGAGQFKAPVDAAVSADGRIYVVEQGNHRVQVFSPEGVYLKQWGTLGAQLGQFDKPCDVTVSGQLVYVVDLNNDRVQIFTLDGNVLGEFGAGLFEHPAQLAVAPDGVIYVTDYYKHVIWEFNADTSYRGSFGGEGAGTRQFKYPAGIDIDAAGNIYIVDNGNNRVQVLNPNTSYKTEWGTEGGGFGQFRAPSSMSLDGAGNLYVADYGNNRIQKFTTGGAFLFEIRDASRAQFGTAAPLALDQNGKLLVIDILKEPYDSGSVTRFTPDGVPLDALSIMRPQRSQHDILSGVAVNRENGEIYLTDRITNRVQRFDTNWNHLGTWGTTGSGPGQFSGPTAITVDADGYVYVVDAGNNRVQKFDANGVFLAQWGSAGAGDGQFQQPAGITVEGNRVYVSDYGNDRVQVFDREGVYLDQWGAPGGAPGQLDGPVGIAASPDGYLLVVDSGNNRVQIFSPDGEPLGAFGAAGSGAGQFNLPWEIVAAADGYVYVTDILNDRVQKFGPVN